uniref:Gnk2-homologous domain-containing protein n=1 Tax=Oryza punctata TaxID=4537 RepID=A0A0E0MKH6_ORYPU
MALLSTLPLKVSSSPTLFARATINSTDGQINAVGQCRGDTNHTSCNSCITRALQDVQAVCVLSKQAIIYYDLCTLEISNEKIQLNIHHGLESIAVQLDKSYVKNQQQVFDKTVGSLITAVINKVTNLSTRFATGKELLIVDNYKYTVCSLAQCSSELTRSLCQFCLHDLSFTPGFGGSVGARKAAIWCSYRYQLYHFFTGYPMLNLYTDHSTLKIGGQRGYPNIYISYIFR